MEITVSHVAVTIAGVGMIVALATWIGKVWGRAEHKGVLEQTLNDLVGWKRGHSEITEARLLEFGQMKIATAENAIQIRNLIEKVDRLVDSQDRTNTILWKVARKMNGGEL